MSDEEILRAKTISIISAKACRAISFTVARMTVMSYGYSYVSDLLARDSIHIAIGGGESGTTASYDGKANTIHFGTRDPNVLGSPSGRQTVVHECTHALIDATCAGRDVKFGDDEAAAYLAQMAYALNAHETYDPQNDPVATPLYETVKKMQDYYAGAAYKRQGSVYVVERADIDKIWNILKPRYAYIAQKQGKILPESTTMDGVPYYKNPALPAMVPEP